MEAVESGPVRQCPPGLIYLETVMSRSLDPKPSCHIKDGPPRAGLDFAISTGLEHGGFVPRGRKAEDGRIADRCNLVELTTSSYPARTRRNIEASDGTMIFSLEHFLSGGIKLAQKSLKLRIERIYPLAEVAKAQEDLESRRTTGKLVVEIN
jgi:hypothetical protein